MNKHLLIHYKTALALKLPVTYLKALQCIRIELNKQYYYFKDSVTPLNNDSNMYISKNKYGLFELLKHVGFPVPNHRFLHIESNWPELLEQHLNELKFPLLIRPMLSAHLTQSTIHPINTKEDLYDYVQQSFETHTYIQLYEFDTHSKQYQVLILKNKILRILHRIPSAELSDGKDIFALSPAIHPDNARYLKRAAKRLGFHLVELIIDCDDIIKPFSDNQWRIVDAHFNPDLTLPSAKQEAIAMNISKTLLIQIILKHPLAYITHRISLWRLKK